MLLPHPTGVALRQGSLLAASALMVSHLRARILEDLATRPRPSPAHPHCRVVEAPACFSFPPAARRHDGRGEPRRDIPGPRAGAGYLPFDSLSSRRTRPKVAAPGEAARTSTVYSPAGAGGSTPA